MLDLYPTIGNLCGINVPEHVQGKDISKMLDDPSHTVHEFAFSVAPMRKAFLIRTDRWAYIQYKEDASGGMELFDMESDPKQFTNLATSAEHQSIVAAMKQILKSKLAELRANDLAESVD